MSTIGIVTQNTGAAAATNLKTLLANKGHTVSTFAQGTVTSSTFSGYDCILTARASLAQSTLAARLTWYMRSRHIPVLFGKSLSATTFGSTTLEALCGLTWRSGEVTSQGNSDFVLVDDFEDHQVTAGMDPDLPARLRLSSHNGGVIPADMPIAGRVWAKDSAGRTILMLCDQTDRSLQDDTEFGARTGFIGFMGPDVANGKDGAALIDAAIDWATATAESGYATDGPRAWISDPLEVSSLGVLRGSEVTFSAVQASGIASALVYGSWDGGANWHAISSSAAIPGFSTGASLAGRTLRLRVDLKTSNASTTASIADLTVTVNGSKPAVQKHTASTTETAPTGWLDGGLVTFRTGLNAGISSEVKRWNASTRTVELFLPMPFALAIGDVFTVYPGCDKRDSTCRDKWDNMVNFGGFPHIGGNDQAMRYPDG